MLLLSSVVRAMQGEMLMPGSMALDKDLGRVEQGTHQSSLQSFIHLSNEKLNENVSLGNSRYSLLS